MRTMLFAVFLGLASCGGSLGVDEMPDLPVDFRFKVSVGPESTIQDSGDQDYVYYSDSQQRWACSFSSVRLRFSPNGWQPTNKAAFMQKYQGMRYRISITGREEFLVKGVKISFDENQPGVIIFDEDDKLGLGPGTYMIIGSLIKE